jgi:CheY-like chemotaxis protein
MLAQAGYSCLEAEDGTEALQLFDNTANVRLIVTDMLMPKMGGIELAENVARRRQDVQVIFMSGYAEHPIVRSVNDGQSLFLAKPFTAATLMETVRQALAQPASGPAFRASRNGSGS